MAEVPIIIIEVDEASAFKLSLLENLQREDLNPVEETEGVLHLLSCQLDCITWMPKPESHLSDSATKPCMKR
ncbi:hypothetical protein A6770_36775 [Nostoc minutum NIES-26]|uniref:ParB/Sulfiredoxin domain-containing protein n=1 Tax=Nostoc minutum NIES-26 TaxID=1844469 RepID=A0A367RWI6_9NOSO|nr:hypothetical protein A6770_36775 [Nostoc minutum NIES-26]